MNPLSVRNVSLYFGGVRALADVSIELRRGERRAIIGTNGAGKTTLFNVISGQIRPSAGQVLLLNQDILGLPVYRRAALGLGRTFQITNLFPGLSVWENMLIAVEAKHPDRYVFSRPLFSYSEILSRARTLLQSWRLWEYRDSLVQTLSYGVQRQLEIVIALAGEPKVLLLDEPMAGLSAAETRLAMDIVLELERSVTVLMIEHDLSAVFRIADYVTAMDQGLIVAEGRPDELRQEGRLKGIYRRPRQSLHGGVGARP